MPSLKKYDFSIIVTTFNEVKSFEEFHNRLVTPLDQNNINYELIVCDDGSNDGTLNVVKKNYLSNPKFTCVIELFRNFGQGAAMSAALTQANGKNYIIIDSDLQIAPEEVLNFILIFRNNEYDAVVGWRKERMDTTTRKIVSKIGNTIMRKASKTTLNDLGCNLKVFDGRLIENMGFGAFKSFRSVDILARAGKIKEIPINHYNRKVGKSGWSYIKLMKFFFDNLVNVSDQPFQLLTVFNLALTIIFLFRVIIDNYISFKILPEITSGFLLSIISAIFFIEFALLSIIGEICIRNLREAQKNPIFIIKNIYNKFKVDTN